MTGFTHRTRPSPFSQGWKLPEGVEHVSGPLGRVLDQIEAAMTEREPEAADAQPETPEEAA